MGADIYLKSVSDAAKAQWQPRFEAACSARNEYAQRVERHTGQPPGDDDLENKKLQQAVSEAYEGMYPDDGYYRDSYNATSLFGVLGLSWWQSADVRGGAKHSPVGKLINKQNHMSVTSMKRLKKYLEEVDFETCFQSWVVAKRNPPEGQEWDKINFRQKGNGVKEWRRMFYEKRKNLIALLDKAIARKEPLYCSV
jgi:hypothetical protein